MSFWRPGTAGPGVSLDRDADDSTMVYNSFAGLSIPMQRQRLPIFKAKLQILYAVENFNTLIIVGETGSGKTTQIPQYLHEAGWAAGGRTIACTVPRRIGAVSVASRVAEEMNAQLGQEVGYAIRFDETWTPGRTAIKYMTDGMLVKEIMVDPLLSSYSVVMVDDAHERSLQTDILLGLLKKIRRKRRDLKIIISSATMDAESFAAFFRENEYSVCLMSVEGRTYPVEINYAKEPVSDYVKASVDTVLQLHTLEPPGDILVFLTGQDEIETVVKEIKERASLLRGISMELLPLPLYSGMGTEAQMKVFGPAPPRTRKVIVATNIAETTVTIDGIVYVVDCMFVKLKAFNARTGMDALVVTPVSQSASHQRSGRAGRLRPGKAYRLCTEDDFYRLLPVQTVPEMLRSNLPEVLLQLKALGVRDIVRFDFMSPPPQEALVRALELLYSLGAVNDSGQLTSPLGMQIAEFPTDVRLAKMLLVSASMGCSEEILTIVAMLSVQSVWVSGKNQRAVDRSKRRLGAKEGDHVTLVNIYAMYLKHKNNNKNYFPQNHLHLKTLARAEEVRLQLSRLLHRYKVPIVTCLEDTKKIRRCVCSGFFSNAAQRQPDLSYKNVRDGSILHIHPSSVLYSITPEWVVYHDVLTTTRDYMREVSVIEPDWLIELAPHFYEFRGARGEAPLEPPRKIQKRT